LLDFLADFENSFINASLQRFCWLFSGPPVK
jgi:hypothetical protein